MIIDAFLLFTGTTNGATGTIGVAGTNTDLPTTGTQDCSNILDIGVLNGLPASAVGGGGARDLGIGDDPAMKVLCQVTTTFGGGTDLQVALEGAPDAGSNTPGSYTIMWEAPAAVAEANLVQGLQLANVHMPRTLGAQVLPRYLKLVFISNGTHTSGAVIGALVLDRYDQVWGTAGINSGYPPGITINN